MDRTTFPTETTPELRAKLGHRLRIVEGRTGGVLSNGATTVSGFSSASSAPVVERLQLWNSPCGSAGRPALTPRSALANSHCMAFHNNEPRQPQQLHMRVNMLTRKNEELATQVNKMKQQMIKDESPDYSKLPNYKLAADHVLAEIQRIEVLKEQIQNERSEVEELRRNSKHIQQKNDQVRLQELETECCRKHEELLEEKKEKAGHLKSLESSNVEVTLLQQQIESEASRAAKLHEDNKSLQLKIMELEKENQHLLSQLDQARMEQDRLMELVHGARSEPSTPSGCSESRLRSVMMNNSSTLEDMKEAIAAVKSYIDEAQREYTSKLSRERRAAFENLHEAIEKADETALERALIAARRVEMEKEDIQKAEEKLAELRALTDEERCAKEAQKLESQRKKDAFLLVKKDDAEKLASLIASFEPGVRWENWRDYAGRTLWTCSQQLRAGSVQEFLAPKLGLRAPNKTPRAWQYKKPDEIEAPNPFPATDQQEAPAEVKPAQDCSDSPATASAPPEQACVDNDGPEVVPQHVSPEEEEKFKARALRAVVKDDCAALSEVLESVPVAQWSKWQNKAGKDLLTLAQERGSACAETALAKALGMVDEAPKEAFEERQAVWVFLPGEVQPRRATVLEDTPEEDDEVLVEFWDGDDPPERMEKCLVRKMFS